MLPEPFLDRMQKMLGGEYQAFLESFSKEKYAALRLNSLKKGVGGESADRLLVPEAHGSTPSFLHLTPVSWAKNGYYYEKEDRPGKHPYHEAGVYYIQEPSAMAPVTLLDVWPGEQVLDLCAAPGGKSTQIAAAMEGKGLLVSNEIHPARAKILSENIERMGIRNACVTNETPRHLAEVFPEYFDRILVDAPCSGEGMFRKNEAACEEWSPENVDLCADRQEEILDCAADMLRPGGRLVYSTCTFAPAENEGSVSRFLRRHPDFSLMEIPQKEQLFGSDVRSVCTGTEDAALGIEKTLRLWPHRIHGEGHFAAVLVREGSLPAAYRAVAPTGMQKGITEKESEEYRTFEKEFMQMKSEGTFLKFGDNLYLLPEQMPNLKGLKVLRPGLHLGTLKKNRFEPSHALALTLSMKDAVHVWNLSSYDSDVSLYLSGRTFPADGEKGWYLICVDGFSLGWGKLVGGVMKNHYPKGLRKNI